MMGKYGYINANEDLGSILMIDTVDNLIKFEKIIAQFDVSGSEAAVEEIFPIKYGDPAEIVQLLKKLLSGEEPSRGRSSRSSSDRSSRGRGGDRRGGDRRGDDRSRGDRPRPEGGETAATVTLSSARAPIILIPEPNRKWIFAKASPEDMEKIREWIKKLDTAQPMPSEYEAIPLRFADAREVADRLTEALQRMGGGITPSVLIQPLEQAGQIVVYGREDIREVVKKIIAEIDIPSGFETKVFPLKHAEPSKIKEQLEALYESQSGYFSSYGRGRYSSRRIDPKDTVRVIEDTTLQQVTVIASPENMEKIADQIAKWDVPLDVEKVRPKIIELKNSDPIRMADLLSRLFSEQEEGRPNIFDILFGRGGGDERRKIVGPLYGQLTFEPVPDTKKIIVISKIPEAYKVVEELIRELDSREKADIPRVITLKYADAEDLCDQLNAILNEPGTRAILYRSRRGLSEMLTDSSGQQQTQTGQDAAASRDEIVPWWSGGGIRRGVEEEMPISNIIGRIRFIPVHRSKAVLVLAPPEYIDDIEVMIKMLDQPGKQVMVKAIIVQVNHTNMTSLGVKLASDPTAFGFLSEGALTMLSQFAYQESRPGFMSNAPGAPAQQGISSSFDLNVLVDLLIKEADGRVLNQPTLWTKDNEEASFFRGQEIAFVESDNVSPQGGTYNTFRRDDVGLMLRVRPNITPEKDVDMIIELEVTQLEQETINTQPVTSKLNMTTNLIAADGETKMLAGILLKSESDIQQKVPLLGDAPLVGGLFRHNDTLETNSELLVFLTPFVIDTDSNEKTTEELKKAGEKLKKMLEELNASID
jgi:general secretion pathway protein D